MNGEWMLVPIDVFRRSGSGRRMIMIAAAFQSGTAYPEKNLGGRGAVS